MTELYYCSYTSCYIPNHMLWVPALNGGCRFSSHFRRRVSESSKTRVAVELN
jgi:hypothetical protein